MEEISALASLRAIITVLVHAPDPRERRSSRDLQNTSAASPVPEEGK